MITALAGGVGAARLLRGMVEVVAPGEITAVVNTGDDTVLHGLHISPDLDTVIYTLAGAINPETGWGLAGETWRVMESLGRLGRRHLVPPRRPRPGHPLLPHPAAGRGGARSATVTAELAARLRGRRPARAGDRRSRCAPGSGSSTVREVGFQEYFVRLRHDVAVAAVRFEGAETAPSGARACSRPSPAADTVVVCPSNPVVSIGPLLAVPGVLEALASRRDRIVGVSPIVAGAALKGPADRLLRELGFESSVVGVARWYAAWMGTLVIDEADAGLAAAVEAEGVRCVVAPTVMSSRGRGPPRLARIVLDAAG